MVPSRLEGSEQDASIKELGPNAHPQAIGRRVDRSIKSADNSNDRLSVWLMAGCDQSATEGQRGFGQPIRCSLSQLEANDTALRA